MCTLTIVPQKPSGVRIVCNRDESRLRPPARPPEQRTCGERQALLPVDPASDGTWIGVSDAPLAAVLLNVYIAQAEPSLDLVPLRASPASRGTIIPQVLAGRDLSEAVGRLGQLNPRRFEPFRLIVIDPVNYVEVVWAAEQYSIDRPKPIDAPLFFTSSGLGDDIVAKPRRRLFEEMLDADDDWSAVQDRFHRHEWADRRFASVWMTRPEARTQSITWVDLGPESVSMQYGARAGEGSELETYPRETIAAPK